MMKRLVLALLAAALVVLSTSPIFACHHRHRRGGCESGCASSCGGGCATSCAPTGCASCTAAVGGGYPNVAYNTGGYYPNMAVNSGTWQPTPPPEPPTNPYAETASVVKASDEVQR